MFKWKHYKAHSYKEDRKTKLNRLFRSAAEPECHSSKLGERHFFTFSNLQLKLVEANLTLIIRIYKIFNIIEKRTKQTRRLYLI
jgi:hypothetical protein